jgi:hypothetical protein
MFTTIFLAILAVFFYAVICVVKEIVYSQIK